MLDAELHERVEDRVRHRSPMRGVLTSIAAAFPATAVAPTSSINRVVSFHDLVGAGEQNRRDHQAERLGGLQIDHELYLNRLLDRQLGGLRPAEDFASEDACLAPAVAKICMRRPRAG